MKLLAAISIPILLVFLFAAGQSPVQSAPAANTYVVNDTSDLGDAFLGDGVCAATNGKCTLRAAIQEANQGFASFSGHGQYTITLPSDPTGTVYFLTIPPSSFDANVDGGDLEIMSNLLLVGTGNVPPIIDAGGINDRVLDIVDSATGPVTVTIQNVVVQHGQAVFGGGIRSTNRGLTTLENVTVISNTASRSGGGIYSDEQMVIDNSLVRANRVTTATDPGGGIINGGRMLINNSTIVSNSITGPQQGGGGIGNLFGTMVLSNSSVLSNTADQGGGGIQSYSPLTVTDSLIAGNVALSTSSDAHYSGGGILVSAGPTLLINTTVSDNRALGFGAGGGIDADDGVLELERSVVSSNQSFFGGGIEVLDGAATLRESSVRFNTATSGGGIHNLSHALVVTASVLNGNFSRKDGGGIRNEGFLTLTNSTLSVNSANRDGGGLYSDNMANLSSVSLVLNIADANFDNIGDGGGIYAAVSSTVYLRDSLLSLNVDFSSTTVDPDCAGTIISADYNLIQNPAGCTLIGATGGNIMGVNPNVGLLLDNGGPTPTHALPAGSIAINHGNPAGCKDADGVVLATDQRGKSRIGRCDIGAFEYRADLFLPVVRR